MKSGSVKDFVAVGDVDIKVIGADNQIPDSEIPVREMLEQIVAKLGIPPFFARTLVVNHRDDVQGGDGRFDYGAVALQKTFDTCNRKDLLNISSQFGLILKTERCVGRHRRFRTRWKMPEQGCIRHRQKHLKRRKKTD